MKLIQNIALLMKNRGITPAQMERDIGIKQSTFISWKKGSQPAADKLIKILHQLADNGNTILIIEHNLDLIKVADYVIDLGPEGGDFGGEVIACGTPNEIANTPESFTGKYLKQYFK